MRISIGNFPDTVNEFAARSVAGLVLLLSLLTIWTQSLWLVLALAFGFLARVLYGPKFSPFARLAIHVLVPVFRLGERIVPGPPKRFAQGIGLVFSGTASALLGFGFLLEFRFVLGILAFFAALECFLGFCAGCFVFGKLMEWGWIPREICEKCNNLTFSSEK
ncbi:DUF4395 domain-containing protein [Leptospira fletcheri]|uniref:DUF4395 domain-containing protein n=1 Tax=Leptospira fletcheri TaxID=2484981 RepID=A0A4R9GKI5_9LEPT|nr:DUF4395 domain-containing protein [Leptospira fletcheri]TGK13031.1 DUF4395 domain-containing protein [Leptospira fletcheri]